MKNISFIISLVLSSYLAIAQHNHGSHDHGNASKLTSDVVPHKGQMSNAGKYKVEMITDLFLKKDPLSFYVHKTNLKPLENKQVSGTIAIYYKDKVVEEKLEKKGEYSFTAQLPNTTAFHCIVELSIKGKPVKAEFIHEGITGK